MQVSTGSRTQSNWINCLFWDLTWFQSAIWIFPLFIGIFYFLGEFEFQFLITLFFIFFRLVHTYFSAYICLAHPEYRLVSRELNFRFYFIPFLIAGSLILFFILPSDLLPLTTQERFNLYSLIFFPLTYWHYALQHYGVISMYRSKAGQVLSSFHFNLEKCFCHLSTTFLITILMLKNYHDVSFGSFSIREFFLIPALDWNLIAFCLILPMVICLTYQEIKTSIPSFPKLLYIWSVGMMALIVTSQDLLISWMLLDLQHFLVVFGLGGHILSRKTVGSKRNGLIVNSAILVSVSVLLSLIYFYFNAHTADKKYGVVLKHFLDHGRNETLNLYFYGFFIATGISHYYFDRLAFRFSDKRIGSIAKKII